MCFYPCTTQLAFTFLLLALTLVLLKMTFQLLTPKASLFQQAPTQASPEVHAVPWTFLPQNMNYFRFDDVFRAWMSLSHEYT